MVPGELVDVDVAALIGKALCFEGMRNFAEAAPAMASALDKLDPKDPRYADAAMATGGSSRRRPCMGVTKLAAG